jgi:AhpD family alkylhydroperoxidase
MTEHEAIFPHATRELADERKRLAPGPAEAFRAFGRSVFADGALPAKTKQLIAVAVAHVTQCPYCIRGHTAAALGKGATAEEIMEAI